MNRITYEDIQDAIESTHYFTTRGVWENGKSTICVLRLKNGFEVIGHSAPVDPGTFDLDIGEKYAYESAFEKCWELFGFALQENNAK